MHATKQIVRTASPKRLPSDNSPDRCISIVASVSAAKSITMPTHRIRARPLPMPRCVICSLSQIRNITPPAIVTVTEATKSKPPSPARLGFFFSSRRRHTRLTCDWSSDVCSSDRLGKRDGEDEGAARREEARHMIENVSRRDFFKTSGALVLAVAFPDAHAQAQAPLEPNAFIRIGADSTVTVIVKHLEMGQGTYTGLPTLVAEELDADWAQMRVEGAPADAKRYNNLFWGEAQGTGGSSSLPNSYEQLRKAGAAARFMLLGSAAERWKVPAKDITIAKGVVLHKKTGRRAKFGDLVAGAMTQVVPADVPLKDPKDFVYIGKGTQPRTDARAKSTGAAIYTQDVKLPGMLTAVVLHPPRFGAKLKSFDAA